jgi:predicted transcriptional regulator
VTRVDEVMSHQIVTISAETSCHDAVGVLVRNRMRDGGLGSLPVVDQGHLVLPMTARALRSAAPGALTP